MADEATPAAVVAEGTSPEDDEGKSPAGETPPVSEEPKGRKYSEAYVKQLRQEAAETRNRLAEAEEKLQEREDADKTEVQRLTDQRDAEKARAEEAEIRAIRYEVASAHQIPAETAKRLLTASTQEEMEAQAEELVKLLAEGRKPATGFDGGARGSVPETLSPEQAHNDFLMRALGREPARRSRAT